MWRVPTSRRACYNHGESIAVGSANKAHTTLTVQHTHTPRTYQRRGRLSASRGTRAGEGMSAALSCAFIKTPLHHEVSKVFIYGHHSDEEDFPGTHSPCSKYGLPSNTMALISPSLHFWVFIYGHHSDSRAAWAAAGTGTALPPGR